MSPASSLKKVEAALRAFALTYPEAYEDHPWGESAFKVSKKVFLFLGQNKGKLGLSVKLPTSAAGALLMPFAEPTGYGLGKSGWVSASFAPTDGVPMDWIKSWVDESYRAIAPRRLVARLDSPTPGASPRARRTPKGRGVRPR